MDVTSPEPYLTGPSQIVTQADRLRVVDIDDVRAVVNQVAPGALFDSGDIGPPLFVTEYTTLALKQIMELLCTLEILFGALYDLPVSLQSQRVHKGYRAVKHLGNASALSGSIERKFAQTLHPFGDPLQALYPLLSDNRNICLQGRRREWAEVLPSAVDRSVWQNRGVIFLCH